VAAHGFGGDVLGEAEGDIRPAGFGDCAVRRPVRLGHQQRAVADIADPPSRRIGPRVHRRPRRGQPPREPAGDLYRPQVARQREDRQPGGLVGGVGDDAGALIAGPLPPGPFRLGQAFGGPGGQTVRVGEQPLSAIANVKRPQAGDRVIPRPATRNSTVPPSAAMVKRSGAPRRKRRVRASWRGGDDEGMPTPCHTCEGLLLTHRLAFRDKAGRDHMTKYDGLKANFDNVEDL
jgi:hypothetical protein